MFNFAWLIGCDIAIYKQHIGFQGRHVDKIRISYTDEGVRFQAYALYDRRYTYKLPLKNECPPNEYTPMGFSTVNASVFLYF